MLSKQILIYWLQDLESGDYTAGRFRLWLGLDEKGNYTKACCLGVLDYCHGSKKKSKLTFPNYYPNNFDLYGTYIHQLTSQTLEKLNQYLLLTFSSAFPCIAVTTHDSLEVFISSVNDNALHKQLPGSDKYAQVIEVLKIMAEDPLFI